MDKQKPVDSFKVGNVEGAIWEHARADGTKVYSYTPQKFYKSKKTGKWEHTNSYFENELHNLKTLIDYWITKISEREQAKNDTASIRHSKVAEVQAKINERKSAQEKLPLKKQEGIDEIADPEWLSDEP